MRKKILLTGLLFILSVGACACSSQLEADSQSVSKNEKLYTVAHNVCLKTGTSFDGDTVLESTDFIGFYYIFDESLQEYVFYFKLTDDGGMKMKTTTKLAEISEPENLSLWVGNVIIVSAQVAEPCTGDEFAVGMVKVNKDSISGVVGKLTGE